MGKLMGLVACTLTLCFSPAIDPWSRSVEINGVVASPPTEPSCVFQTGDGSCYNVSYGASTCAKHDATATPECAAADPAAWCKVAWCWVDPKHCERPFSKSSFFGGVLVDGDPLSYSYATCGNLNYFHQGDEELKTLGRKLRISWPSIGDTLLIFEREMLAESSR